jgi:hypothetical protein
MSSSELVNKDLEGSDRGLTDVLFWHTPRETEENCVNHSQDNQSADQ